MLSLKATLKAIGESITTIKSALDGKATKYTGYGTPVTLTASWYTIPSDGVVYAAYGNKGGYMYLYITNADGSNRVNVYGIGPVDNYGYLSSTMPVFKGQKVRMDGGGTLSDSYARFYPFI